MSACRRELAIRLMHGAVASDVLGPERRVIVWVRGCPHICERCIVPEGLDLRGGGKLLVSDVAE